MHNLTESQDQSQKEKAIFLDDELKFKDIVLLNKAMESLISYSANKLDELVSSEEIESLFNFKYKLCSAITSFVVDPRDINEPVILIKNKGGNNDEII